MDISLVNQSQPSGTLSGQNAPVTLPNAGRSKVDAEPVKVAAVEEAEVKLSDDKRFKEVERAAQSYFKDVFAVSDAKFTIFKDGSGQFVTRFTSLRDGRVTYIPEPDITRYMESKGRAREALVEIDA